jgi:hypothetical protein
VIRKSTTIPKTVVKNPSAQPQPSPAIRERVVFDQADPPSAAMPGDVWVNSQSLPERKIFVQAMAPKEAAAGDVWITP